MNILITGSNGQLGNEMRVLSLAHPAHTWFFTDVDSLDITCREAVCRFVRDNHVDLIVNCAAYTNVDRAEQDEPSAMRINADAVANLAAAGARIIHISTDYVFSGDQHVPCREDDPVAPRTAYGRTKLRGEQLLLTLCPEAVILRTAWLYSPFGNNFVKTMIRLGREKDSLAVVFDQIGTPTYAADLAAAVFAVIEAPEWHPGIYHYTNEGVCSWYDFALAIHELAGITGCLVRPILSDEYPYRTPRPHYSVLDKSKFKRTFALSIPHWLDGLKRCMSKCENE